MTNRSKLWLAFVGFGVLLGVTLFASASISEEALAELPWAEDAWKLWARHPVVKAFATSGMVTMVMALVITRDG